MKVPQPFSDVQRVDPEQLSAEQTDLEVKPLPDFLLPRGLTRCQPPLPWNSTDELQGRSVMEEWGFVDDRELDSFRGHRSCSTCSQFRFAFLIQSQLLGC